ncbi:uncharacterized protein BDCG_16864 [Blastomyces dermatitidis ER-3]|uniref:Uncharacterized protein n=1 Tax=Ajellomyces dermatitidis (strain ER-3 / ATCC MYA-2586) TaxID=559297 RepID=A0ABX2VV38_AJEDR|nr:uncharacterized protein BDCG_16864 [Blastomyces dermatitidis ER-3]EQL28659.1 hypothetical protein BDFG_08618 [Blastomyces dermatitidis ATCC 26199]OAT01030.1 hypothetical protein BDCG_16864 [Blastomyces dermatitidis ER-3]
MDEHVASMPIMIYCDVRSTPKAAWFPLAQGLDKNYDDGSGSRFQRSPFLRTFLLKLQSVIGSHG